MKISISSFLIILWISSGDSTPNGSPLTKFAEWGTAILPRLCSTFNKGIVPPVVQGMYEGVVNGLTCQTICERPNGEYHFEGTCDSDNLSDPEKETFCRNGVGFIGGTAKRLGCPTFNCTINADGNIFLLAICPQILVPLDL